MAKAIKAYFGKNAKNDHIHVAMRADGAWFHRNLEKNRYGTSWSKWAQLDREPKHPARRLNKCESGGADEYIQIPEADRECLIEWGNGYLEKFDEKTGFRLPS